MRVLITGCSSGIGRDAAAVLTARGHEVVATARRVEDLAGLEVAVRLPLDVTDAAAIAAVVEQAGPIDALVNNAGFSLWGPVELVPTELEDRMLATNLVGAMRMTRAFLPGMRTRGFGRVVQVSSLAAQTGRPLVGLYAASKAGLEAWSTALREEVAGFGIGVTVIRVGAVESAVEDKRIVIDGTGSDYAEFVAETMAGLRAVRGERLPASRVSEAIGEAIEAGTAPAVLRVAP
jgi:short-subunit dehydrogenase